MGRRNLNAERYLLESEMKDTALGYLCWAIVGCHYAYLGRWGMQVLFWITAGGLGLWALIDLFRIPGLVRRHNWEVAQDLAELDEDERRYLR